MRFQPQTQEKKNTKESILAILQTITIVGISYVVLLPTSHNNILYPMLMLIGTASSAVVWIERKRLPSPLLIIVLLWACFVAYGTLIGLFNAAPGLLHTLVFFLLSPALYALWALSMNKKTLKILMRVLLFLSIVISSTIILFIKQESGDWPALVPEFIQDIFGLRVTFEEGIAGVGAFNLALLLPLSVIWVASLCIEDFKGALPRLWLRVAAAILTTLAALTSGRQAISLIIFCLPVIILMVHLILTPNFRHVTSRIKSWFKATYRGLTVFFISLITLSWLSDLNIYRPLEITFSSLHSLVNPTSIPQFNNSDQSIRSKQFQELTESWFQSPILGHGFGSVVSDPARHNAVWKAELQYNLILAWTGIIGLIFLVVIFILCISWFRKLWRHNNELNAMLFVSIVSAVTMLIANASNPYLQAPGHMWVLFLPLGVAFTINTYYDSSKGKQHCE